MSERIERDDGGRAIRKGRVAVIAAGFFCLFGTFAAATAAAPGVVLSGYTDNDHYFLGRARISVRGKLVTIESFRVPYRAERTKSGISYRYTRLVIEADCSSRRTRWRSFQKFASSGVLVSDKKYPESEKFEIPIPKTIEDAELLFACDGNLGVGRHPEFTSILEAVKFVERQRK